MTFPEPPIPPLETQRLRLRGHRLTDFEPLHAMWSDPEVTRFITGAPSTRTESWSRLLRYAGHWAHLGYGYWAVEDRATGAFIGETGLADYRRGIAALDGVPEAGWVFAPAAHGKGLAGEAVRAVLRWADADARFATTACIIDPDHHASRRLAGRQGYQEVGLQPYGAGQTLVYRRQAGW